MKTSRLRLIWPLVFILQAGLFPAQASLINIVNGLFSSITNAIASALPGDVVVLPPGTNVLTQTINLYGVSLIGSGTNQTVLVDEENRSGNAQMINIYPTPGHVTEVANLQLCGGVTNTSINYYGAIACIGTTNTSWRVDNCVFNGLYAKSICTYGNSASVIDHNVFYERSISIEDNGYIPGDGMGDESYAYPPTYGLNSTNALYVEDNYFTNLMGFVASVGACDGEGGARMVFRYNTVWNDCFNNHGTESGGRLRSERSFEIYGNTFTYGSNASGYPCFAAALIRGGSGVIFSNTANGYYAFVTLRSYRYTTAYCGQWEPFCGASGVTAWDSNSPTLYLSGVSAGPNGATYLQVTGANWTPNQWYGYTVMDINNGLFAPITSNTSNTIYYIGSDSASASIVAGTPLTFNNGDGFQIHLVYAALDQPGRGSGDFIRDDGMTSQNNLYTIDTVTGVPSWPREALEPIYSWGNTLSGANTELSSSYPGVLSGRDYYNDTPKPGYTPYIYPHPLDLGGPTYSGSNTNNGNGGNGGNGGNTNSNSNTNQLLPPSNLHIIGQ
ncbi:MAG TPA: hypothetical protein VGN23_01430 [Verrucomicrobiae bacterium]|jgi:hypothetical protein